MRNKKKIIGGVLALAFVFSGFNFALAETESATPPATRSQNKTLQQNNSNKDGQNERAQQARIQAIRKLMNNHILRNQKFIDRLGAIIKKIENRKDKMSEAGIDVSSLDSLIQKAKTKKSEAEAALALAKEKYNVIETATDPKTAATEFQAAMKDLMSKLRELHSALKDVVKAMKDLDKTNTDRIKAEKPSKNPLNTQRKSNTNNSTSNTSGEGSN